MESNFIYSFLQKLPTNGYTMAIGGIASLLYGVGGLIIGALHSGQGLDSTTAIGFIIAGWTALGAGSKADKLSKAVSETPPVAG